MSLFSVIITPKADDIDHNEDDGEAKKSIFALSWDINIINYVHAMCSPKNYIIKIK